MRCSKRLLAVLLVLFAAPLSLGVGAIDAHDGNLAKGTLVAAQTAKQRCMNICYSRYRDCRRLGQLPSFECRDVYRDCTQYTCSGSGPG
jgi:hypothetical protein